MGLFVTPVAEREQIIRGAVSLVPIDVMDMQHAPQFYLRHFAGLADVPISFEDHQASLTSDTDTVKPFPIGVIWANIVGRGVATIESFAPPRCPLGEGLRRQSLALVRATGPRRRQALVPPPHRRGWRGRIVPLGVRCRLALSRNRRDGLAASARAWNRRQAQTLSTLPFPEAPLPFCWRQTHGTPRSWRYDITSIAQLKVA